MKLSGSPNYIPPIVDDFDSGFTDQTVFTYDDVKPTHAASYKENGKTNQKPIRAPRRKDKQKC